MKKQLKELSNKSKTSIILVLVLTTFFASITAISSVSDSDLDHDLVDSTSLTPRVENENSDISQSVINSDHVLPMESIQETDTWNLGESVKIEYTSVNRTVKDYELFDAKIRSFITEWGAYGTGDGEFRHPRGVAVTPSKVYVVDRDNNRIQVFDLDGNFIAKWGSFGSGDGEFAEPYGIAVTLSEVYVVDSYNYRIQVFNTTGGFLRKWGSIGSEDGEFSYPCGIAVTPSEVYVADTNNNRIQVFDLDGNFISKWGSSGSGDGEFSLPRGIFATLSEVYVVDSYNDRIQVFNTTGGFIRSWGSYGFGEAEFWNPIAVSIYLNEIYVADTNNHRIQLFSFSDITSGYSDFDKLLKDDNEDVLISLTNQAFFGFSQKIEFILYDVVNPETVSARVRWEAVNYSEILETVVTDTVLSVSVTGSYSSEELKAFLTCDFSIPAGYEVTLSVFDTGTNEYVTDSVSNGSVRDWIIQSNFYIDYVFAESETIESNSRFDYSYTSASSILRRLNLECFNYRIPIKIYTDYDLASIDPIADTGRDPGDSFLWVNNTVPLSYTLYFTEEAYPKFVALIESSNDYLTNVGFEGGWQDDWRNKPSEAFANVALNTTIVSEGAFSLRLSNDGTDILDNYQNYLPDGYYYISFSYYLETAPATYFRLYHREGGAWVYTTLLISTTDRWIYYNEFMHITDHDTTANRNLLFQMSGAGGILFLDNVRIWKSSVRAETAEYSETTFGAQFISWDGYSNPPVPYLDVNFDLRDRTADTSVDTYVTTTDASGVASWIWKGHLDQKEYEIRSWSYDSWWGSPIATYDITEFLADPITSDYWDAMDASLSTEARCGSYAISDTESFSVVYYSYTGTWDFSNVDYISMWLKPNISVTNTMNFYIMTDWNNDVCYQESDDITAIWNHFYWEIDDDVAFETGTFDITSVNFLYWNFNTGATTDWLYDEIKLIQSQKSYFTPLTASNVVYEYESGNEWDWSEGTGDSARAAYGAGDWTVENGYVSITTATGLSYARIEFDLVSYEWDTSYYNTAIVRVYANDTLKNPYFYLWKAAPTGQGSDNQVITSTGWNIFEIDLSGWKAETGTELQIYFDEQGGVFEVDYLFRIDILRLVHRDSSLSSGYNWEFEEDGYKEGWFANSISESAFTVNNGEAQAVCTGQYDGIKLTSFESDTTGFDYLQVEIKASVAITGLIALIDGSSQYYEPSITTEWQTLLLTINFDGSADSSDYIYISSSEATSTTITYRSVRLIENTEPNLYETTTQFSMQSENNTLQYRTWLDGQLAGDYRDIENIQKNLTIGSHSFNYAVYLDFDDSNRVYLPSACYYYSYEVSDAFYIQSSWSVSDSTYHLQVTPSHACSYQIYVNGSGAGSGSVPVTGTTLSGSMLSIPGLYLVNISFTYSTTAWSNNSYSVPELSSWSFEKEIDFDLLDQQCSVTFKTDWNNLTGYVYENSTYKGSFSDGETFTWQRNTDYSYVRNVTAVLWDGSVNTSFAWFYRNEDANTLFIRMYPPEIDSDRITISVASNWEEALFTIDDNATAGIEVSGELAGTFVFTRTSSYGSYQINVTGYYDFNGDGAYDSNEKETVIYPYSIYEEALVLEEQSSVAFIDRKASVYFKSNYYESNRSQFRVLPYNSSDYTSWMYEKTVNGSYSWDTSSLSDGYYCGVLEIRVNITTSSGNQTIIYCPFDYYVYDNVAVPSDVIIGVHDNNAEQAAEIADLKEEIADQSDQIEEQGEQISGFSAIAKLISTAFFGFICLYCYVNREELMKTVKRIVLGKRSESE